MLWRVITVKKIFFASALLVSAVATTPASAVGEQWFGFYVSKGGLQISVGPFTDRFKCEAAQYKITYGSKWMGCRS